MSRSGLVRAAVVLTAVTSLMGAQALSRQEIENARRYVKTGEPAFKTFSEADLRRAVAVAATRNYAYIGYNTPEVEVRLPRADNSDYAVVTFPEAKPLDAKGQVLPHEIENGLYSHETHSIDVRFTTSGESKGPVPLVRAAGKAGIRYPLAIRTRSIKKGSPPSESRGVTFDGPFVSFDPKTLDLLDVSLSSDVAPLRAYDAAGRRLEFYDGFNKSELVGTATRRTIAFWGPVASLRLDTVEKWTTIQVPFDLKPAPLLPAGREGLKPESPNPH